MQKYIKRAIEMISGLALTKKKNPSVIPPVHTKNSVSAPELKYFKRTSPATLGISPLHLASMLHELEAEPRANVHNLMVIKDGKLIFECSAPGYDTNTYHLSHSMSKTVTGIAIGMIVEEYGLDVSARLVDIFPDIPTQDSRFENITVEHLLAMRSGVPFSELGTATESNWTETFFSSELSFNPGEKFHYNSLNSYILAKIVCKYSGISLVEYLKPRLFEPLHIDNYLWELSPEGVEKGGFGLYMSTESWAKVGFTLLNMGVFEGKQIIPRSWVLRSITERSVAPESVGAFNYGYHIWVNRTNDEFLLNGMLGQNVWVCPKNNIVAAINCGNGELFQGSPMLDIVRKYLGGEIPAPAAHSHEMPVLKTAIKNFFTRRHKVRPKQPLRGISYLLRLKNSTPFDEGWNPVLGEYAFPDNNSGLLPLFVSVMQNNFGGGIEKITLKRVDERLFFTCTEGGILREMEVGIYGFKTTVLTWGGESYIVNAMGEAMEDEDRNPVYKIALIFPELPNSKLIKLTFENGRLLMRMSETPNQQIAESYLGSFTNAGGKIGFAMGLLERKLGENFLERKLTEAFNPRLLGISCASSGWEEILFTENMLAREVMLRTSGGIASLINKFVGDNKAKTRPPKEKDTAKDKSGEKEGGKEKRGFFSFLSKWRRGESGGEATELLIPDIIESAPSDPEYAEEDMSFFADDVDGTLGTSSEFPALSSPFDDIDNPDN